ncbi:ArsR family transcriptional regulator [Halobellus sp. Atlit-38R]|jgi:predicted transcriptional regulator|uniref:winged helix-turn-helix domain-containing protein n=1 Tax=Halobellus sp. Atlit-38R TaxID=2282131 RepID=UPI000EF23FAD|nr:winged helix-turn-helix domain-containing protein [Halobellus sp. Atlit-38R]RLM90144.1 ArsR family transcriptional regulator [Halobellus sp. Atlit-38R]
MSPDEPTDDSESDGTDRLTDEDHDTAASDDEVGIDIEVGEDTYHGGDSEGEADESARARLEAEADRAVSEFDEGIVDLLAWLLDTETRARIYVYLRKNPHSTSEEVADGTGLYPSTVREALAELHDEETVTRRKRESAGAGNNPYEYTAIAPSELVRGVAEQVQSELNTVFNLDRRLGGDADDEGETSVGPVTITVGEDGDDAKHDDAHDASDEGDGDEDEGGEDDSEQA